jgi:hypothetical protein
MLESDHLILDELGLQHGDGSLLERDICAAVKVGTARADAEGWVSFYFC